MIKRSLEPTEHQIQTAFFRWFRTQYPLAIAFSIPNGMHLAGDARRRAIKMRMLKDEGLTPGVPDIFIPEPRGWCHGMFLELKRKGNKPTPEQNKMLAALQGRCFYTAWAANLDDAIRLVSEYMASTK